jgi:hypothetical protein
MKRKRYTTGRIIGGLKEAEARSKTADLYRQHSISQAAFFTSIGGFSRHQPSAANGKKCP